MIDSIGEDRGCLLLDIFVHLGFEKYFFMALGINQVTYSNCKFCQSVGLSVDLSWFCHFRHFQVS